MISRLSLDEKSSVEATLQESIQHRHGHMFGAAAFIDDVSGVSRP